MLAQSYRWPCQGSEICLWDLLTGQQVLRTKENKSFYGRALAFSPDGKLLAATSVMEGDGLHPLHRLIRVLETATCQEIGRFDTGGCDIGSLTFAPDGLRLASSCPDGTVLVWDLRAIPGVPSEPSARLDADALALLWKDLDANDAAVAYRALCALAASPKEAVEFLAQRLTKVPPLDVKEIPRLITALDSDDFEKREAASRKLSEFGRLAEPALKEAASSPSAEVRRRAEALLAAINRCALPGQLRDIRAVQVLERIGTPEARRLLEALAGGELAAALTRDAKAAVERLCTKEARP